MQFLKNLFEGKGLFNEDAIIGLSGIRKRSEYVKVAIPSSYKKTYIPRYENNYMLF